MDIVTLLISLASGLAGGNIAGAASKDNNMGAVGNSIVGLLGGGFGGYVLQALDLFNKAPATGVDLTSLLANIGTSGVSGAILVAVVSLLKSYINKA